MVEITNQLKLFCTRKGVELTEIMSEEQLNETFNKMPDTTKRAIISQYIAATIEEEMYNAKPGTDEQG